MATDTKRRLTPIIIKSRHFSTSTENEHSNEPSTSETATKSRRNHVEFSNRVNQTTNAQRRESFFQHYLRRISGSGGNLLSVARARPLSTTSTCLSLATTSSSSSSVVVDLYAARQQSTLNNDETNRISSNNINANDDTNRINDRRIGDKRLQAPRLSLLGRPIMYRSTRSRNVIYRVHQLRLHNFLERPDSKLSVSYHLSM